MLMLKGIIQNQRKNLSASVPMRMSRMSDLTRSHWLQRHWLWVRWQWLTKLAASMDLHTAAKPGIAWPEALEIVILILLIAIMCEPMHLRAPAHVIISMMLE